jgi:predicted RecA/RadA family phage recombinase
MATAIVRGGIDYSRTLKYAHTSAVAAGDVLVVNGNVVVANNAYAANAEGIYTFRSRVEFPKEASLAINPGDKCYWVAGAGNVNKTSAGNTAIGICVEAALAADTVVLVELSENRV